MNRSQLVAIRAKPCSNNLPRRSIGRRVDAVVELISLLQPP